jgi:hypothetical protein
MSDARHRRKGNCGERAIVAFLRGRGFATERVPLSGSAGALSSATLPLLGGDLGIEAKICANGFREQCHSLSGRDLLIVRADQCESPVIRSDAFRPRDRKRCQTREDRPSFVASRDKCAAAARSRHNENRDL